jgi:Family of unknown function (DUF6428)
VKLHDLRTVLEKSPAMFIGFVLPDGDRIPAHAHVTEVGHVVKNFIDCGGVSGNAEIVVLQTHVGEDTEHRLKSDRLLRILQLGNRVLPHDQLDVEIEYDCCVVAQYPVAEVRPSGKQLDLILEQKRTQCLARERAKNKPAADCCATATSCC